MIKLKELFDTQEKMKWKKHGDDEFPDYEATFMGPNNRKYKIEFQSLTVYDVPHPATQFANKVMSDDVFDAFFDLGVHIEFGDTQEGKGITGLGGSDTSKVFGIVINAIVDKIKKEKIDYIFFSAKEPSRKELYKKLAPLIATKLGWKGQANNGKYYFLSKDPLTEQE